MKRLRQFLYWFLRGLGEDPLEGIVKLKDYNNLLKERVTQVDEDADFWRDLYDKSEKNAKGLIEVANSWKDLYIGGKSLVEITSTTRREVVPLTAEYVSKTGIPKEFIHKSLTYKLGVKLQKHQYIKWSEEKTPEGIKYVGEIELFKPLDTNKQ